MESYKIENLTFKYPASDKNALDGVSFTVNEGEFITVCGKSGCGKSTLLRHLKPAITPHGTRSGSIFFSGEPIENIDFREQSEKIGFVAQSPDNQLVTDKVWHEMAFGAESLGMKTPEIRAKVAEMASFFGIQTWFHKNVSELSGGQKQLLNLASVMVMQPDVLILDEPTSQLDPIAAQEFIDALVKINRELAVTVILSEHRLEEALAVSDRVIVLDNGRITADDAPSRVGKILNDLRHDMFYAMPSAMRIYAAVEKDGEYPVTVREGRGWLQDFSKTHEINRVFEKKDDIKSTEIAVELKEVFFRYEKNGSDVLHNMSLKAYKGETYAIVGGNGSGKTTALSLICGINSPQHGAVMMEKEKISEIKNLHGGHVGMLPQNPQTLFVKKTVMLDLYEMLSDKKMTKSEKDEAVREVSELCGLNGLLSMHPYDLSGGEQQRAALAKLLLLKPRILLLDEPTKGLDAHFKTELAEILQSLKESGVTIIMVSHDIEFCAEYADRCAMLFDGSIVSEGAAHDFFAEMSFYTTAAGRIARGLIPNAVLTSDVIRACGGTVEERKSKNKKLCKPKDKEILKAEAKTVEVKKEEKTKPKILLGIIFALLFILTEVMTYNRFEGTGRIISQIVSIMFAGISVSFFLPQKTLGPENIQVEKRHLTKRTLTAAAMILLAVPLTIYVGIYFLGDRKYYFISLLIIIETLIPFFMLFENRKVQLSEIVIISVLCAIAVAGRGAFGMLPQFKPVAAIVIISGVAFGGETGFLVGAITAFVSNFFFGQGPWTPWQMFAFGIIGFLSGVLFQKGLLRRTRVSLCIFGFFAALLVYGGIMNTASVFMMQSKPNAAMFISVMASGLPFDIIHAVSTVFFLWIAAPAMIEKLDRVKIKYGLCEEKQP